MGMHFSNTPSLQLIKEGDGLYRTNETTALPSAYVSENVQFAFISRCIGIRHIIGQHFCAALLSQHA